MKKLSLLLLASVLSAKTPTVAIDIGHTPKHFGAVGCRGVVEYKYNYTLAKRLNKTLSRDFKSFLINQKGGEISLKDRVKTAKKKGANLLISLHHDSAKEQFLDSKVINHQKVFSQNLVVLVFLVVQCVLYVENIQEI